MEQRTGMDLGTLDSTALKTSVGKLATAFSNSCTVFKGVESINLSSSNLKRSQLAFRKLCLMEGVNEAISSPFVIVAGLWSEFSEFNVSRSMDSLRFLKIIMSRTSGCCLRFVGKCVGSEGPATEKSLCIECSKSSLPWTLVVREFQAGLLECKSPAIKVGMF